MRAVLTILGVVACATLSRGEVIPFNLELGPDYMVYRRIPMFAADESPAAGYASLWTAGMGRWRAGGAARAWTGRALLRSTARRATPRRRRPPQRQRPRIPQN